MKSVILTIVAVIFTIMVSASAKAIDDVVIDIDNTNSISQHVMSQRIQTVKGSIGKILEESILTRDALLKCKNYGYRNLELRFLLVTQNMSAFEYTGEDAYLKEAIFNAKMAENNYKKGNDIYLHDDAEQIMFFVYHYWKDCIKKLHGSKAAQDFARMKGIEQSQKQEQHPTQKPMQAQYCQDPECPDQPPQYQHQSHSSSQNLYSTQTQSFIQSHGSVQIQYQ